MHLPGPEGGNSVRGMRWTAFAGAAIVIAACKERRAPAPDPAGSASSSAPAVAALEGDATAGTPPDASSPGDAGDGRSPTTWPPRSATDLVGSYSWPDPDEQSSTPPEIVDRLPSQCASVRLESDGSYIWNCDTGFVDDGEWTYTDGILFYRATREEIGGTDTRRRVNDYGARRVRVVGDYVCFDAIDGAPAWPGGKVLGKRIKAEEGGAFPTDECFLR
jgi:hypothetical protein